MKRQPKKMISYLAVTAGVGCVSSTADAAVVFYGVKSANDTSANPAGIGIGLSGDRRDIDINSSASSIFYQGSTLFTKGSDNVGGSPTKFPNAPYKYTKPSIGVDTFVYGASFGRDNYIRVSFNGDDNVFEAVAQFYFDGAGGGYLIAIATTNPIPNPQNLSAVGGTALSISAGKAMISAAAVPEPSGLVLLALGATGLAARRQRRKAA